MTSQKLYTILGIETSCDDTSIAIVRHNKEIVTNKIYRQIAEHEIHGGIVPEVAARKHIAKIHPLIEIALSDSGLNKWDEIDAIAVTSGPGLIGSLIVGTMVAQGISDALNKPCIAVNHLVGHALTPRLTDDISFPYLVLLTSGGHCIIAIAYNAIQYEVLGETVDDAAGEVFDKIAKILNIGYPGGPYVEKIAKNGNENAYHLPMPFYKSNHCDFSFSGLKTAVMRIITKHEQLLQDQSTSYQFKCDICASFQKAVASVMVDRISNAINICKAKMTNIKGVVLAGGVAANLYLREKISCLCYHHGLKIVVPPVNLCTDNGAMIAWAGIEMLAHEANIQDIYTQLKSDEIFNFLESAGSKLFNKHKIITPRSRWPLDYSKQ